MIVTILIALMFTSGLASAKDLYRAPTAGDKGAYYILEAEDQGDNIVHVLSSRVGNNNAYTDFTELKVNCKTKQYFKFAGSDEDGAKDKPSEPLKDWSKNSKWTSLVTGSSKHDLVMYVCK